MVGLLLGGGLRALTLVVPETGLGPQYEVTATFLGNWENKVMSPFSTDNLTEATAFYYKTALSAIMNWSYFDITLHDIRNNEVILQEIYGWWTQDHMIKRMYDQSSWRGRDSRIRSFCGIVTTEGDVCQIHCEYESPFMDPPSWWPTEVWH